MVAGLPANGLTGSADNGAVITQVTANAYRIPTSSPETDGTASWKATTIVVAHIRAGGKEGIGYSYADASAALLINQTLAEVINGLSALDIPHCWITLCRAVRNIGRAGIAACAIAALDNALWDLKAKLLELPLLKLLGAARAAIPVYGSGGFTNYSPSQVAEQIAGWREQGITQFKIKIGRDVSADILRIQAAVEMLPPGGQLLVDANGAYHLKQALMMAEKMAAYPIVWFEEPVTADDRAGLRFMREHAPPGMDIAAGEYGDNVDDFRHLLEAEAVDVLQVDATRCQGISGFLKAAALSEAHHRLLSSHCAPGLHAPLMCHIQNPKRVEYFWDHTRIEQLLFEGVPAVHAGCITPQTERSGLGITLKMADAEKFIL